MAVDSFWRYFHNSLEGEETVKDSGTTAERTAEATLEETISRALRENLVPLQDTSEEIQRAYADVVAACTSGKPGDALPSLLRAQTAASSLAGGLSALSNFVANFVAHSGANSAVAAVNLPDRRVAIDAPDFEAATVAERDGRASTSSATAVAEHQASYATTVAEPHTSPASAAAEANTPVVEREAESEWAEETAQAPGEPEEIPVASIPLSVSPATGSFAPASVPESAEEISLATEPPSEPSSKGVPQAEETYPTAEGEPPVTEAPVSGTVPAQPEFDLTIFPVEIQDLHRRANRVAKVAMQDIKLLRPKDVQLGREHNDICDRLRSDIDKARKEYDRRFRAIQDHPVDYFHRWMVEILAGGDSHALGEYPYPSPVLRR